MDRDRLVAPAELSVRITYRFPVHLEHAIDEVHDPVVGEAGPRVEAAFVRAVEGQA